MTNLLPLPNASAPLRIFSSGRLLPCDEAGERADAVLRYWFGEEADPREDDYKHPSQRWFRGGTEVDEEIRQRFGAWVKEAAAGRMNSLRASPHGCLALVLLLDQFPRHIYRGTAGMFCHDEMALSIAEEALSHAFDQRVACAERLFFYFALEHAEDIEIVRRATALKARLRDESPLLQRPRFERMWRSGVQHIEILERFGRYSHRNALLGRASTPEEEAFLQTTRYGFMQSTQPLPSLPSPPATPATPESSEPAKTPMNPEAEAPLLGPLAALAALEPAPLAALAALEPAGSDKILPLPPYRRKLRLLVLHSFRQNARVMRSRTKKMSRTLADEADLIYANAPLPYQPKGEIREAVMAAFGRTQDTEHQRCWWNATEGNEEYEGLELSIAYLKQMNAMHGPFDGLLGFSQGGALVGLVAAQAQEFGLPLRFVICISGFPSRAKAHEPFFRPASIKIPSLHIVGANDILVDPLRTIQLSECFASPLVVKHSGGHFVPDRWPLEEIKTFLRGFLEPKRDPILSGLPEKSKASKEEKFSWLAETTDPVGLFPSLVSPAFASSLQSPFLGAFWSWLSSPPPEPVRFFVAVEESLHAPPLKEARDALEAGETGLENDDILLLAAYLRRLHPKTHAHLRLLLAFFLLGDPPNLGLLEAIPRTLGWEALKLLAAENAILASALPEIPERSTLLHQEIVRIFADQLSADEEILMQHLQSDLDEPQEIADLHWPSECALHAPKRGSAFDKHSHLARDIALSLLPLPAADKEGKPLTPEGLNKAKAYRTMKYRHLVRDLRKALDHLSLDFADRQRNARIRVLYEGNRSRLAQTKDGLPQAILHPLPEPVLPCAREELEPLLDWLHHDSPIVGEIQAFTKGTALADGRLDLCKQVVGPEGIGPLLEAMQHSSHVRRLLLGNNIVGDGGARQIAAYIRSGLSKLDCWYIAGNLITAEGLQAVTEAIEGDSKVRHLWLKRNPLGPQGAAPLCRLLAKHPTLEVLDLLNCGLLDEGLAALEEGWKASRSLRHLYIDANGLTPASAEVIARCLLEGPPLRTLFLSCNRFGDEGVRRLAPALKAAPALERFSLASNRLTKISAAILRDAFAVHPTLLHLDLGYMRGTGALGEVGNFLGDDGATSIAQLLGKNTVLQSIDLLHNDISQRGLQALCSALRENRSLVRLQFTQFSKVHNEYTREEIRSLLERNEALTLDRDALEARVLFPTHLQEIHSVYRTRV